MGNIQEPKRVIIIGGGVSVKEGISLGLWERIKNETVFSCNYAYKTMPYLPAVQLWVDRFFWEKNVEDLQFLHSKGVKLVTRKTSWYSSIKEFRDGLGIELYKISAEKKNYFGQQGIEKGELYSGEEGLVGTFALSYAVALKIPEIYLLGFDFGTPNAGDKVTHYYQGVINVASTGVGNIHAYRDDTKIKRGVKNYEVYLQEKNIGIYNVSPLSNIQCFPKLNYQEFFQRIGK